MIGIYILKALALIFMVFLVYIIRGTYKVMESMPAGTKTEKIDAGYIAFSVIIEVIVLIYLGIKVITG